MQVDETHEESAFEALTALCNICGSPRGRDAILAEPSSLRTLASGLGAHLSPWRVLEVTRLWLDVFTTFASEENRKLFSLLRSGMGFLLSKRC